MNNVTILLHLWNLLSLSEMCKQFDWSHNTTLSLVAVSYATNLQRTHYHNKPFSSLCSSLKKTWLKILRVGWETSQLETINSIQLSLDRSVDCTHCLCTSEPQKHLSLPSSAVLTALSLHQVHWGRVMQSLQTVYCSQSCAITAAAWGEEGTIVQVRTLSSTNNLKY